MCGWKLYRHSFQQQHTPVTYTVYLGCSQLIGIDKTIVNIIIHFQYNLQFNSKAHEIPVIKDTKQPQKALNAWMFVFSEYK